VIIKIKGGRKITFLAFLIFISMEFNKKTLLESLSKDSNGVKTFSEKPQNIVINETQLERLIDKLYTND
jgi:hypothetical protein